MPNPTLYDNFSQVRQYIDQNQVDLSSYVTKDELNGMSYATTSQLPVIDENIIPKANNTYNLGDANNQYTATYAYIYNLGPENSWERQNNWQTKFKIDGSVKYYLNSNRFMPNTSGISLGASTNEWAYTYTKNLILNGTDVNNVFPTYAYVVDYVDQHGGGGGSEVIDENIIPKANNTYTLGNHDYYYAATYSNAIGGYTGLFIKVNNNNRVYYGNSQLRPTINNYINLGTSDYKWKTAYSYNYYLGDEGEIRDLFPTYAYVVDYVDQHGGGGSTVIDENIIPKANNTYTLGNANNQYATVYTYNINLNQSQIKQDEYSIGFNVNGNNTMRMFVGSFRPWVDKGATLGSSSTQWSTTYTQNLILNGTNIKTLINNMFSYDSATGTLTITTL